METLAVDIKNLYVTYDERVILENINLEIARGAYVAIIGPNGGGKTTLLKTILGLIKPIKGKIKVFGFPSEKWLKSGTMIGYIPQRPLINPNFPVTVYDTVLMGRYGKIGLFKHPSRKDKMIALENIERVGLGDFINQQIGQLSGGQQQKAFIARALCNQPKLLILDEPTIALDASAQDNFYQLLKEFKDEMGLTIIMVTHDLSVVSSDIKDVVCLNQKIFSHPGTPLDPRNVKDCYGCQVEFLFHTRFPHRVVGEHDDI